MPTTMPEPEPEPPEPPEPEPELAMLWEAHDPRVELRRRFGFDSAGAAADWIRATLDERWGLSLAACERIVISAGNALVWATAEPADGMAGPRRLIAKLSAVRPFFPGLAELSRLSGWLFARGLPVAEPVPTVEGALQVELRGLSMGVQAAVEGTLLDVEDPAQVRAAGAALATLHEALAAYPRVGPLVDASAAGAMPPLRPRMLGWLDGLAPERRSTASATLRSYVSTLSDEDLPTRQLVHRDFRSANLLWAYDRIAAVLDFEEIALDHRVADLAHGCAMLATRYHAWGPTTADTRAELVAGYESVRPLTPAERAWLPALVLRDLLGGVPASGDDPAGWAAAARDQLAALGS